jgi:hypothetical protein
MIAKGLVEREDLRGSPFTEDRRFSHVSVIKVPWAINLVFVSHEHKELLEHFSCGYRGNSRKRMRLFRQEKTLLTTLRYSTVTGEML